MVGNQVAPEVLEQLFGVQAVPDAYTAAQLALLPGGKQRVVRSCECVGGRLSEPLRMLPAGEERGKEVRCSREWWCGERRRRAV